MDELFHTLTDEKYIAYVKYQEQCIIRQHVVSKTNNQKERDKVIAVKAKSIPMTRNDRMRLICCFQDDAIVEAYKRSQEVLVRTQLDPRNSDKRLPDFYDLIVENFNNTEWVPYSVVDGVLHEDFQEPMAYPKREEYSIDAVKVKRIFSWEKSNITAVLRAYSKSGNGAVNGEEMYQTEIGDEDPEKNVDALYGHFDMEQARTNGRDDRKKFLSGKPTDVLYWWKVLDELQLITLICVAMREKLGASSSSRPISISTMQKEKKSKKRKEFQDSVVS